MFDDTHMNVFRHFLLLFLWLNNLLVMNFAFFSAHVFGATFAIVFAFLSIAMLAVHATGVVKASKQL